MQDRSSMDRKVDPLKFLREDTASEEATLMPVLREQAKYELDELRESRRPKTEPIGVATSDTGFSMEERFQGGVMPSKVAVTQRFGNYNPALYKGVNEGSINTGTDFGVSEGTPLALPQGNWVIKQTLRPDGFNDGFGGSVMVVNENTGESLRFSHLSKLNAIPGKRLRGGSVIGYSGATGRTTGAHLDLEMRDKSGKLVDVLQSNYAREIFGGGQ